MGPRIVKAGFIMAYSKILVGYDCSQAATRALSDAYELVDHGMAESVIILMVTDPERTGDPAFNAAARAAGVLLSTIGDEEEALGNLKNSLGDQVSGHEDVTTLRVAFGKPQDAILSVAEKEGCGLIVMGSRGLGAVRAMLGSVSTAVLRDSSIPVLVTK